MDIYINSSEYWSKRFAKKNKNETEFWHYQFINEHINHKICGEKIAEFGKGTEILINQINKGIPFKNAISVGCGLGEKEMNLIELNLVDHFTLVDISEYALEKAAKLSIEKNIEDKISIIHGDAFEKIISSEEFDLVYWNSSLHHMTSVRQAMEWSYKILQKEGLFFFFEYIGPNRMQYSQEMILYVNIVRSILPKHFFRKNISINSNLLITTFLKVGLFVLRFLNSKKAYKSKNYKIVDMEKLIAKDPSEAIDSENIISEFSRVFNRDSKVIFTGGLVYFIALNGILENIDENKHNNFVKLFLMIDDLLSDNGFNLFATGYARK